MGKPWLKLWTETVHDQKLRRVAPAWRWAWMGLMCLAAECEAGGRILDVEGAPMADAEVADLLGLPTETWLEAKQYFMRVLTDDGQATMLQVQEGSLFLTNYAGRQASVDPTSRERGKRYRSRSAERGEVSVDAYRAEVAQRDGGRCVYCGSEQGNVIDHMVPLILGGKTTPDNLAAACKSCNSKKSGRTPLQAGMSFCNSATRDLYATYLAEHKGDFTDDFTREITEISRLRGQKTELTTTPLPPLAGALAAEPDTTFGPQFTSFSNAIGFISGAYQGDEMKERLRSLAEREVLGWWDLAIKAACDNNKRSWAYVRTILDSCLQDGRPPGAPRQTATGATGSNGKGTGAKGGGNAGNRRAGGQNGQNGKDTHDNAAALRRLLAYGGGDDDAAGAVGAPGAGAVPSVPG
jgi:hypothetical protein